MFRCHINSWEKWLAQDVSDFGGRKPRKIYADDFARSSPVSSPTIILGEDNCWNREEWTLNALNDRYGGVRFAFGTIEDQDDDTDDDEILMTMNNFYSYWHAHKDRNPL